MTPVAVGKREGYLAVAPSAPFALHNADHAHRVRALGGHEYLGMADLALEPVGMHLVRVDDIVHIIALGRGEDVHLKGRHFLFLRVEGRLRLYDVLPDELGPVNEAVPVLGESGPGEGLRMPAHACLVCLAGRSGSVSADSGGLACGVEVYEACRVVRVDLYWGLLLRRGGLGRLRRFSKRGGNK